MTGTISRIQIDGGITLLEFEDGICTFVGSGFGLRQLAEVFGGNLRRAVGQTIEYEVDECGCMTGFSLAEEE